MSTGHKGMVYAAKTMGMPTVERVQTEYKERKGDEVYKAIVPKGIPPIDQN